MLFRSAILTFVGVKMLMEDFFHVPVAASLIVIASILAASIVSSLVWPDNDNAEVPPVMLEE